MTARILSGLLAVVAVVSFTSSFSRAETVIQGGGRPKPVMSAEPVQQGGGAPKPKLPPPRR